MTSTNPRSVRAPSTILLNPSSSSSFCCQICLNDLPSSLRLPSSLHQCRDPDRRICRRCTASYIKVAVSSGSTSIGCPFLCRDCPTPLNPIECMDLAVSDDFLEKWCRLACEESLLGLRRCHCPNPNCREMIIDECHLLEADQRARRIVCPACKKGCCFRCLLRWEEVKERHRCDQVIAMAERKKWMECPGCRNYVDRTEGCKDII